MSNYAGDVEATRVQTSLGVFIVVSHGTGVRAGRCSRNERPVARRDRMPCARTGMATESRRYCAGCRKEVGAPAWTSWSS